MPSQGDVIQVEGLERAARMDAERLLVAYETQPDPFAIVDRSWMILYASPAAIRAVGPDRPRPLVGRVLFDVFPEFLGTRAQSELRAAMGGVERRFEIPHPTLHTVEVHAMPAPEGLHVRIRVATDRMPRVFAKRLLADLPEPKLALRRDLGRTLGRESPGALEERLLRFSELGLGALAIEARAGNAITFSGIDLLERDDGARRAQCDLTLGFLEGCVGEGALGAEVACVSRGAPVCRFVVRAPVRSAPS